MQDSISLKIVAFIAVLALLRYLWVRMRLAFPKKWHLVGGILFIVTLTFSVSYRLIAFGQDWLGMLVFGFGGFWMVFLSHWLFACLLREFLIITSWIRLKALGQGRGAWKALQRDYNERTTPILVIVFLASIGVFTYGWINQSNPKTIYKVISVDRPIEKSVRLALITDIHFDPLFQASKWEKGMAILQKHKPDLVLLGGDLSDLKVAEMERMGIDTLMQKLQAPMGVYAVTGNHEFYMMRRESDGLQWFSEHGIQWIRDASLCLEFICLSGREDKTYKDRALVKDYAPTMTERQRRPWILVDHQPIYLHDQELAGLGFKPDLGLSGHTHAGQFFPWTFVIHYFWEHAYGHGSLVNIPWIVSAGFGQWGPPIRVGSNSEVWIIDIKGKQ